MAIATDVLPDPSTHAITLRNDRGSLLVDIDHRFNALEHCIFAVRVPQGDPSIVSIETRAIDKLIEYLEQMRRE